MCRHKQIKKTLFKHISGQVSLLCSRSNQTDISSINVGQKKPDGMEPTDTDIKKS